MRLVVAINDRCTINSDGRRRMVRSIDRCFLRPILRTLSAPGDRAYDQSWHPKHDGMINHGGGAMIDSAINRSIVRPIVRPIFATYDRSYDQRFHETIWNRRLEVLNMSIDLATTDSALAITHDLCDQS